MELGPVIGQDGRQVFGPRLGQGLDRLENLNRTGRAGKPRAFANAREVELERPDGLSDGLPSIVQTFPCRCAKLISSNHIRRDMRLGTLERDVGGPPLCKSPMNGGGVGEAEVAQVPEEAGRGIATATEIAKERARAAAKSSTGKCERQGGNEGTEPGLLEPVGGRLDEFLRLSQLGTRAQA